MLVFEEAECYQGGTTHGDWLLEIVLTLAVMLVHWWVGDDGYEQLYLSDDIYSHVLVWWGGNNDVDGVSVGAGNNVLASSSRCLWWYMVFRCYFQVY